MPLEGRTSQDDEERHRRMLFISLPFYLFILFSLSNEAFHGKVTTESLTKVRLRRMKCDVKRPVEETGPPYPSQQSRSHQFVTVIRLIILELVQ